MTRMHGMMSRRPGRAVAQVDLHPSHGTCQVVRK